MVTIADVARRAGVSTATVSHVINGTRHVTERTRRRVLAVVEELDYVPNRQARSLVRSRSQQLGVAISAITNLYFGAVVRAMEAAASEGGYTLILADTHEDPRIEEQVVTALRGYRLDGLLLAPSSGAQPLLDRLARTSLPTVLVDRAADARFDSVCTENVEPMADLVAHLAEIGHRRIAMVSGMAGLTTTDERVEGYRLGLTRAGLSADPRLVVSGGSDARQTYTALAALLDAPDPPTAVVAAQNAMVIGTMRLLRDRGLDVPDDIALVGFDDFEWADVFSPRLTTVAQDAEQIGSRAVELLLDRIADGSAPPRAVRVPARVMHRDSCGCANSLRG